MTVGASINTISCAVLRPAIAWPAGHPGVASYDGSTWGTLTTFDGPYSRALRPLTVSCNFDRTCLINLWGLGNAIVAWGAVG